MRSVNIMLVDDHKIIRDGIKSMLESQDSFSIVAEAESGKEALQTFDELDKQPDLIIMDINMPAMDGIEATRRFKEKHPEIKILALTMMKEDEHIRQMIQAGAAGYILKNSGSEELIEAINTVIEGKHFFSNEATYSILMELIDSDGKKPKKSANDPADLTERELEILNLITQEFTNQEIADQLTISVRTVDAHRRNLLQKTGARNTAGLVRYALENHLF